MNALRTLCLAVGGWLPLVLVLTATPSLARQGVGAAAMAGAVTYIGGALTGALSSVTRGLGGTSIRLSITLQRIAEASGSSLDLRRRDRGQDGGRPGRAAHRAGGTGQLSLRNVTFAYGPHAEPVLRDLCLDMPGGDHLAIVGPGGIGKSTLAGLAAGLLRPRAGEVWLDGLPVSAIPAAELPKHRVLIPQEAYVFDGTLGENLRYLVPEAADADLDASAGAIGLSAVLTRLGGYGGHVIPAALSAGERQLIALARATCHRPESSYSTRRPATWTRTPPPRPRTRSRPAGHADRRRSPDKLRAAGQPGAGPGRHPRRVARPLTDVPGSRRPLAGDLRPGGSRPGHRRQPACDQVVTAGRSLT